LTNGRKLVFPADGYTLQFEDGEESAVLTSQVRFASGSPVSDTSIESTTFLHFDDNSISSLEGMTLVDLDDYASGYMDSYYIAARQILQKEDGIYGIENNNTMLEFEDILLKTGEQTYLMSSPVISIQQSNGKLNNITDGFVEISYLDDNNTVARLSDGEDVWQFLADGATVTLQNGAVLDVGSMELISRNVDESEESSSILLGNIAVNVNASVNITVSNNSADAWEAPTFIINAIDGTDGTSGESGGDGGQGEDGVDGEQGENGEDGIDGEDGTSGSKGSSARKGEDMEPAKDGSNASDGDETTSTQVILDPRVSISEWMQDAGSFSFKLLVYKAYMENEEGDAKYRIESGTLNAYLLEVSTGNVIDTWDQNDLVQTTEPYDGEYTPTHFSSNLSPSSSYKFVVQANVLKTDTSTKNITWGKTILLSRTFTTDANGFYLQKLDSAYLSTAAQKSAYASKYNDSLKLLNSDIDYFPVDGSYAFLALEPVVSGGQTIESISDVAITFEDLTTGEKGEVTDLPLTDADTKFSEWENMTQLAQAGLPYPLSNLRSNTKYTITMTVKFSGDKTSEFSETYLTLKATPSGGTVRFDVNAERYFISSLQERPYDPDDAIVYYTHELYAYNQSDGKLNGESLRTKESTKVTDPTVYFYLDPGNGIKEGSLYGAKVSVSWYDNEKYVTMELNQNNDWSAQCIQSSTRPYIQLQQESPGVNTYSATLFISPGGGDKKIYVGKRDVHRLMIQISSAKSTTVQYYTSLKDWKNSRGESMTEDTEIPYSGASIQLQLDNLFADTVYTITVSGCMDEESGTMETIGTTTFVTKTN
jgi:hypothetical protein